jgi:hypothetical protein
VPTCCHLSAALFLAALIGATTPGFAQQKEPDEPKKTKEELEQEKKAAAAQKELWKAAYTPTRIPDRVILTWNGDPATTQAVTWRTDTTVTKAVAQIAVSEGGPGFDGYGTKTRPNPEKTKTVPAKTEPLKSDLFDAHYHSAVFTGLKPKTRYVYRVGDGRVWSEWFEFRTASDKPDPLSFIYFGDAQNDVKSHWSRVVRGAYSDMPKANFILHAGDLINRANADGEWGEWHQAAGWINGMVPSIPTPGNHEYAVPTGAAAKVEGMDDDPEAKKEVRKSRLSQNWRPGFTLPENGPPGLEETVYYIDIQGVRVISLNSNEKQEEQVKWLERVLADNPNKWTIITFHHPIYSTAKGRDNKKLRELWRPVFDKYVPDLVLQGHDHTYGRSGPMREDNLLTGARLKAERGTVYAVSVSGPKMYKLEEANWMQSSTADTQLYQLIKIDGDVLHYEARTANGEPFDSFQLFKRDGEKAAAGEEEAAAVPVVPAWLALGVFGTVFLAVVGRKLLGKAAA